MYNREFKEKNKVDKIVVLWTANTERYSNVAVGLNDTTENLLAALDRNEAEISPSTLYAIACMYENVPFINGSPQNTFVPGFFLSLLIFMMNFLEQASNPSVYCNCPTKIINLVTVLNYVRFD